MKKRGISPLIATVLLIGFTVVLAAIFMLWGGSLTKKTTEEGSKEQAVSLIAQRLDFDIKNGGINETSVTLIVENKDYEIESFKIIVRGYQGSQEINLNKKINKFESQKIIFDYNKNQTGEIYEITLIPNVEAPANYPSNDQTILVVDSSEKVRVTAGGGSSGGTGFCIENWNCTNYGSCVAGRNNRTCYDLNNCGTELSKPQESADCDMEINFDFYSWDPIGWEPKDHAIIKKGNRYHLFSIRGFGGSWSVDPEQDNFAHAVSLNLTDWNVTDPVVPVGPAGSWDSKNVWAPYVIEYNGLYYMFYTGVNYSSASTGKNVQQIGLATSTDLYNWDKYSNNPVLTCNFSWNIWGPGQDWNATCRDSMIIRDDQNNRWLMYFTAEIYDPSKSPKEREAIGIANSSDLYHWSDLSYIAIDNVWGVAESPFVLKHDSKYILFYSKYSGFANCTSNDLVTGWVCPGGDWNLKTEAATEVINTGNNDYLTSIVWQASNRYYLSLRRINWTGPSSFFLNGP